MQGQGGNEERHLGLDFTTHMGKEKEQMYASAHAKRYALNMKHTLGDNKDLFLLCPLLTHTHTHLELKLRWTETSEAGQGFPERERSSPHQNLNTSSGIVKHNRLQTY